MMVVVARPARQPVSLPACPVSRPWGSIVALVNSVVFYGVARQHIRTASGNLDPSRGLETAAEVGNDAIGKGVLEPPSEAV
jgi:hypothetical protein